MTQRETDGADLADAEKAGDATVDWEYVLTEHTRWLRPVIANRLGSRDAEGAVDDVLQEVALAAIKTPPGTIPAEKIGAWLYQVAVRQTLLYRRKSGRQRKLVNRYAQQFGHVRSNSGKTKEQGGPPGTNAPAERSLKEDGNPLHWLLAVERAGQIRLAFDELHWRDREILLLKYEQGWNYRQLAEHMSVSESAIEARLYRARKRLRRSLMRRHVTGNDDSVVTH